MTLTNILNNEDLSEQFRYDGEAANVYERKILKLVKQYKQAIIGEFKKRGLLQFRLISDFQQMKSCTV